MSTLRLVPDSQIPQLKPLQRAELLRGVTLNPGLMRRGQLEGIVPMDWKPGQRWTPYAGASISASTASDSPAAVAPVAPSAPRTARERWAVLSAEERRRGITEYAHRLNAAATSAQAEMIATGGTPGAAFETFAGLVGDEGRATALLRHGFDAVKFLESILGGK